MRLNRYTKFSDFNTHFELLSLHFTDTLQGIIWCIGLILCFGTNCNTDDFVFFFYHTVDAYSYFFLHFMPASLVQNWYQLQKMFMCIIFNWLYLRYQRTFIVAYRDTKIVY